LIDYFFPSKRKGKTKAKIVFKNWKEKKEQEQKKEVNKRKMAL